MILARLLIVSFCFVANPSLSQSTQPERPELIPGDSKCDHFEYPARAMMAGAQGVVRLKVTVGQANKIEAIENVKSAGDTAEHRLLDRASISQAKACLYRGNKVVETGDHVVEYQWALHDAESSISSDGKHK